MDSKKIASEAKEHECEYYLDGESIVYGCECGDIEIGGKTYCPEDKVNLLKEEITRLKAELEKKHNDLLDALDLKEGNGSTALSMLKAELERERELRRKITKHNV